MGLNNKGDCRMSDWGDSEFTASRITHVEDVMAYCNTAGPESQLCGASSETASNAEGLNWSALLDAGV